MTTTFAPLSQSGLDVLLNFPKVEFCSTFSKSGCVKEKIRIFSCISNEQRIHHFWNHFNHLFYCQVYRNEVCRQGE